MQCGIGIKAIAAHRAEFLGAIRVRAGVERELAVIIYRPGSEGHADLFEVVNAAQARVSAPFALRSYQQVAQKKQGQNNQYQPSNPAALSNRYEIHGWQVA